MAKLKYILLDEPVNKNIICHKSKPKQIREYQNKGIPKASGSKRLCLKCDNPFIPEKGYRLCENCRNQNNTMGDFGLYSYRSAYGKVYR